MARFTIRACLGIVVCGSLVATAPARADERSADVILREMQAVQLPRFDAARQNDSTYVRQYVTEQASASARRATLIGELYQAAPEHPDLARLLPERWQTLSRTKAGRDTSGTLYDELNTMIARGKSDDLRKLASFWKATLTMRTGTDDDAKVKAVEDFIALDPKDARGASLLVSLGSLYARSDETKKAMLERAVASYPENRWVETARGVLHRLDGVGKPFDLEFTEAISGSQVATKNLKGKVVVIDFWATWCGPCVAEMPKMKTLYAEYKDKGVEFIGVSLDNKDGGLDKLKTFVKEKEISWPQYYQGDGWNSQFSRSWGINLIPTVFVIDQEGKLYSVDARGQLEKMIPELLNRAAPKTDAGAEGR